MTSGDMPPPVPRRPYSEFRTAAPRAGLSARARRLVAFATGVALLGLALLGAGFFTFLGHVSQYETEFGRNAEAAVVLTGGPERIADALSVLAEGRVNRLLISGVGERTVEADLVRQSGHAALFECCVDLDHRALNTVGNAAETARWVKKHGYRTLMVVTSNVHMPRTMLEFRRHIKTAAFIAHPVIADSVKLDRWWSDLRVARLLIIEYLKYLVAEARSRVLPDNP